MAQNLPSVVAGMLTKPVTRSLPPMLRGIDRPERAGEWIRERDLEGTNLLVVERENVGSQRVLEKAGFICDSREGGVGPDELLYRLSIEP